MKGLTPAEVAAIAAIGKSKSKKITEEIERSRSALKAGSHPVDFAIRVKGRIKVGEETKAAVPVKIPHREMLAILLSRIGSSVEIIEDLFREAIDLEGARLSEIVHSVGLPEWEEGFREKNKSFAPRAGSVSIDVEIDRVGSSDHEIDPVQDLAEVEPSIPDDDIPW